MENKIGILTYHRAANYGAVLQAYALQTKINNLGGNAEVVNYYCYQVEFDHRARYMVKKGNPIKGLLRTPLKYKKDMAFDQFRKTYFSTPAVKTFEDLKTIETEYSLFVVGSDQMWNNRFSGMDPAYFLQFTDSSKRYSYAVSLGFDQFPAGLENQYYEYLKDFQIRSLRESSARDLLESYKLKAQVDVDPTLLLTSDEWSQFASNINEGKYILIYTVDAPEKLLDYARELSKKTGYKIKYLNNTIAGNRDLEKIRYVSPEDFVGWFKNAEYVLTNSFHGTVFGLQFHKKMKVELETKKKFNVRSRDLLNNLNMEKIIFSDENKFDFDYDWNQAKDLLENMRKSSYEYLNKLIDLSNQEK